MVTTAILPRKSRSTSAFGLDFVPLHAERFDLVARRNSLDLPGVRDVLDTLQRSALRRKLETLAGYETGETGRVVE